MIRSNLSYINLTLEKKYKNQIILYAFWFFFIALLETIGVGVIPGAL